jgi:hypothetical protein
LRLAAVLLTACLLSEVSKRSGVECFFFSPAQCSRRQQPGTSLRMDEIRLSRLQHGTGNMVQTKLSAASRDSADGEIGKTGTSKELRPRATKHPGMKSSVEKKRSRHTSLSSTAATTLTLTTRASVLPIYGKHAKRANPIMSLNKSLKALAQSKERGAATRAEQLLLRVEKLYNDGYYAQTPDVISYNTVMNAWSKSGERYSAQRAEDLLFRMEDLHLKGNDGVRPNTRSFNTVINAFAKSGGRGSAQRAMELLEYMEVMCEAGNRHVRPDTITYNCVLDALARSREDRHAAEKAERLLRRMQKRYASGDLHVKPNARSMVRGRE